ncbi:MAG: hypothetical protein CVT92_13395 [Bacteroidetes bacterium HGW-Bacteroidetes-1]|jgi:hypothetical protein|nr:MAG: hypothetical protein CVT92_13395 [Bacteroidetes bacterium HGW-Bacteroidetes-1]
MKDVLLLLCFKVVCGLPLVHVSKIGFFSIVLLLVQKYKNQARTELPPALKKQRKSSEPSP